MKYISKIQSLVIISFTILLTGCGTSKYWETRNVKIKTLPNACVYLPEYKHYPKFDGFQAEMGAHKNMTKKARFYKFLGQADEHGNIVIKIGSDDYKQSGKRVLIAKAGYEDTKFKLKRKFNASTLFNILLPPAFIFDHYKILSQKKINKLNNLKKSPHTSEEYYEMAENASKKKEKTDLYKKAIFQDVANSKGDKVKALNQLALMAMDEKEWNLAYVILKRAKLYAPNDMFTQENWDCLRGFVAQVSAKKERREQRFNNAMAIMNTTANVLNATASVMPSGNSASTTYESSSASKSTKKKSNKRSSVSDAQNERNDRRTYDNYVDQLSRMKTGLDQYNDSNRRNIQSKMKQLRAKHNFPKNELEDWNGSK